MMYFRAQLWLTFVLACFAFLVPASLKADPLGVPGDMLLRHDLELLNDSGAIDIPLSAWPLSNGDIYSALESIQVEKLSVHIRSAYRRTQDRVRAELDSGKFSTRFDLSGAVNPRFVRSFEDSPRDEGQLTANLSWLGERFAMNLSATAVADPFDGDEIRPDGTYVGVALGNWMLTAGWQDRWWGPGREGSLILSTNARPAPGITIQRNASLPFSSRWLKWIGPWTLTSFMSELDDSRTVDAAWLFGIRGSFRPAGTGLEIGVSRTAQWCGERRPCNFGTFTDLLIGNDNRGVNVLAEDEPGNQLGGFDIRWRLPNRIPVALYMQWIGEDGRGGGGAVGSWLRQVGAEHWGSIGELSHRTHFEISDSMCREGGLGFSDRKPNCAYEHGIYRSGYRYNDKAIGHALDRDGLSYSFGSTLVQSAGHSWNILLRYMEVNRDGVANGRHTLSPVPVNIAEFQMSHRRMTKFGQLRFGLGFSDIDGDVADYVAADVAGYIQWSSN